MAFQATPVVKPTTVATCLPMKSNEPREVKKAKRRLFVSPSKQKRRGLLKNLTAVPLSALSRLKKDERNKINKKQLVKLALTIAMAFATTFHKVPHALATHPLYVSKGAVTPLIVGLPRGIGIVEMPVMRGITPSQVRVLPNQGVMLYALALCMATTLLQSAGEGYPRLMRFMAEHLGSMIKDADEREGIELGLPKETNWEMYSRSRLDPLQKKKVVESNGYSFDPRTNLFVRIEAKSGVNNKTEEAMLQKANKSFQDQKYKQHHHPLHVVHSKYEQVLYLDTLAVNEEEMHDVPQGYLDTLSTTTSTWDVYKHQLDDVKPASEIDELKDEVSTLQSLMQIEQSMYQASNQALKLAVDAQHEGLQHSSNKMDLKDFDSKLSTHDELKAFDKKAQEFEEAIRKDAVMKESKKAAN